MNLRQLEQLVALAKEGSFARAAEEVHLSQPALTRSIQALEQDMELQLFDRHPRGVTLTSAGKLVMERAQRVLFEARALERDVSLYKNHDLGDVSFGFGPYPAVILLSQTMAMLNKAYPRLSIRAEVGNWTGMLAQLHAESIDFFVTDRRGITHAPELATHLMTPHRCGWFVRAGHPVFKNATLSHALLRQMHLASVPLPPHMREEMRKALRFKSGDMLNFLVECNSVFSLKLLAEQSDIVIYAPLSAVSSEVREGRLQRIEFIDSPGFDMQFVIVYLANRSVSPTAQRAMEVIIGCDRSLHDGSVV